MVPCLFGGFVLFLGFLTLGLRLQLLSLWQPVAIMEDPIMQEVDDDKPALAESISDDDSDGATKLAAEDDATALLFAAQEAKDEATATYVSARFPRFNALTG